MAPSWVCPFLPVASLFWLMISLVVVWELVWKGIALWKAGRNGHLVWFICILIFNTLGILPIIYVFFFSQPKPTPSVSSIENE
jgi:hypothetical protein